MRLVRVPSRVYSGVWHPLNSEQQSQIFHLNPFQPSVTFHIETSHLICNANQIFGFYMNATLG